MLDVEVRRKINFRQVEERRSWVVWRNVMLGNIQKGRKLEAISAEKAWKKHVKIMAMRKNRRLVWKNKESRSDPSDRWGQRGSSYRLECKVLEKGVEKKADVIIVRGTDKSKPLAFIRWNVSIFFEYTVILSTS